MNIERIKSSGASLKPPRDKTGKHTLAHHNWVEAKQVKASFDIAHDGSNIFLTYYVHEDYVRAVNSGYNSSVWEDSCVEFFFSLSGEEEAYYNFEFNAIGTALGAYGRNRNERTWLPSSLLEKIEVLPSLGHEPFDDINMPTAWTLQIKIPVSTLSFSKIKDISDKDGHANFYKCGDKLRQPHFLSWKPVLNPIPDFHLPRYFGQLSFL